MGLRLFKIILCIITCFLLSNSKGHAQDIQSEGQIEVSLRMIGHQVLLSSGDSTSTVMPIIKKDGQYKIQFDSEFAFEPDKLASTIDRVVKETGMASRYIVGVEKCNSGELIYSFKIDDLEQSDIIPCKSRDQPRSCYSLLITLIEPVGTNSGTRNVTYVIIGLLLVLLALGLFYLWRKRKRVINDPNLIRLGGYYFDKLNTELLIEHERIELTGKEADLLLLLYNAANTTVEREVILNMVWGDEGDYVGRTLDVFISKLRKKLEYDSKVKIVNIRGVGYKLVMDI